MTQMQQPQRAYDLVVKEEYVDYSRWSREGSCKHKAGPSTRADLFLVWTLACFHTTQHEENVLGIYLRRPLPPKLSPSFPFANGAGCWRYAHL